MLRITTAVVSFLLVIVVAVLVLAYFPMTAIATPTNVTGYSKYTGGSFSLLYPETWTVHQVPGMGIPGSEVIALVSKQPPAAIVLMMLSEPELITSMNMTQEEIESNLEQIFPRFVKGVISAMQRGTLTELQSPDYDKYIVDGHRVGSVAYKVTYGQILEKDLLISTIVGENIFGLVFFAPEYAFDQSLPTFENVIKSIKFLQPLNATNNVQNQTIFAQLQSGDNTGVALNNTGDNTGVNSTNVSISEFNNTGNITEPVLLAYVDRANGINIQYPASWRISLLSYPGLVALYAPLESLYDSLPPLASISMIQYRNNISISEYSNLTLTSISQLNSATNQSNQSVNIKSAGPIFISGYPAYRVMLSLAPNMNNPLGLEIMQAWTVVGNRVYIMSYTSEPSKFTEYLPDAESILRSFVISNTT